MEATRKNITVQYYKNRLCKVIIMHINIKFCSVRCNSIKLLYAVHQISLVQLSSFYIQQNNHVHCKALNCYHWVMIF